MCETSYCLYVYLPDSLIIDVALVGLGGLIIWKLIKAAIDTIPIVG